MSHNFVAKVLLVLIIVALNSCGGRSEKLPEGVLGKEELTNVIMDIQLLESAHKSISVSTDERNRMRDTSYTIVFNKYGINKQIYDSSLRVYSRRPELLGEVLEEVGIRINARK